MKKIMIYVTFFIFILGCAHKNFIKENNVTQNSKEQILIKKKDIGENKNNSKNQQANLFYKAKKENNHKVEPKKRKNYFPRTVDLRKKDGKKEEVNLVFDNVDVYEVINTIIGDILGNDFIINPSIKNKISMKLTGNYSRNELIEILSKALDVSGLSLIKDKKLFKIIQKRNMSKNIKFLDSYNYYTIEVVQLKHLAAYEFVKYIRPFLSDGAVAISVNSSNTIILADKKENIANIRRILTLLDNAIFQGITFRVVKLNYLTADEAVKLSRDILRSQALFSKSGILKDVFITPIKSNNSLLLIARDEELMKLLLNWIKVVDKPNDEAMSKVYVLPVANVKAEDLANILKQLYGGKVSKTKKGKVIVKGTGLNSGTLSGEVTFIPDKINNLLVVKASPADYKIIYNVFKKLDVIPRQVLIDVLIAEISYNSSLNYGIQWYLKNKGVKINGRSYNGEVNFNQNIATPAMGSTIGSKLMGFSYALYDKAGGIRGILNALEEHSKVKILASPSILSVDNKDASIEIGQDVPIITQSVTNTNSESNITNSIQYKKTGVILKVKPQINPTGLVRLDIDEEVSEAQQNKTSGIDSPIFLKRSAKTSLVVFNNQTIVIGGLIKEKNDSTSSGVPFLRKIPILGYLFGGKTNNNERTELVIAITPHIIDTRDLTEYFSAEFVQRVKEIKNMLEKRREKTFNDMEIK